MRVTPILAVDGILTVIILVLLPSKLEVASSALLPYLTLIWIGFASVHITGWLALVAKVGLLEAWLTKNNLIKIYDKQDFLWIYLIMTVGMLWLVLS